MSVTWMRRAAAAVAACMVLPLGMAGCGLLGDDTYTLKVELETSSGLFVGNDVGVLGVPVGEVTSIEPKGDHVLVTLEVDSDVKVPEDAGAVVVSRSMATDRYVELTPVWSEGPTMKDGAVIEPSRTRTPVEWDEVLGAIDTLAEGLNGQGKDGVPIKRLINRTAKLFDGNGQVVRDTITNLVTGTGVFAEHSDSFVNALENLDVLTREIAANQVVAREFIDNVSQATALIDDEKQNLTDASESIAETIRLLGVFVKRNEKLLGSTATRIEDLSARFLRHEESFSEGLRVMPVAMENLGRAINDKGRLDVKLPFLTILPGADVVNGLCTLLPTGLCDVLGPDLNLEEILEILLGGGG
ncbi:MCE family protein [Nocardioides alcanivorans]|uniref:MCE family protein n=1 Tax=Nocardioides alcanivorans TaxID=2897352 RepID=UPI001F399284|nr:MCE family protein [Nocardioides alcanivorans]